LKSIIARLISWGNDNSRSSRARGDSKAAVDRTETQKRCVCPHQLVYLPPYSPGLNPIEQTFANSRRRCGRPRSASATASGSSSVKPLTAFNRKNGPTSSKTLAINLIGKPF
jgi:hypothetical protein